MSTGEKAKKGFKMPHLFWIMMGLLLFACLLTYIIPGGEFWATSFPTWGIRIRWLRGGCSC